MVSFAFLAVMAFSAVPSPLYGLYRARDHFSLFMVTVIYAVYAVGVIGALLLAGHLSDWYGRRRLLLPALGLAIVSAIVFLVSKSLAGLLVGRLLNGIAIGIVVSTATAYLTELHAVGRPAATARRAQLTASAIPVGGIGVGALVAGILAQWVAYPLTVPYLVFLAALVVGTLGVALSPETREGPKPRPRYRPQRVSVPHDERSRFFAAALSAFMAFATLGLFTGLAAAVSSRHAASSVSRARGSRLVCHVRVGCCRADPDRSLADDPRVRSRHGRDGRRARARCPRRVAPPPVPGLFIVGGGLIGAGGGTIFRGAVGTVMSIAPPDRIAESLAGMFLAAFLGLSLPVVGAGITLSRHVSPKDTILGFAIAVSVGIAASAIRLVGRHDHPGCGRTDSRWTWRRLSRRQARSPTN